MSNPTVTAIKINNYGKARAQMLIKYPFFAAIVLSTEFIEDYTIPTACTDYLRVWYNPTFMDSLSIEICTFVIVHEIGHIILKHNLRRGNRKPIRWNKAADYAWNQEMRDAGVEIWEGCLVNTKYTGMSAEQIYDMLTTEQDKKNKGKKPGKKGQGPGGDQSESGMPNDDDDIEELGPMGSDMDPNCAKDLTQNEASDISQEVNGKVANAATMARAAGKMPGNLSILVDGIINPPQPWEVILREFMTRMVQTNETWNRRNRRYTMTLPSRQDAGMGELCIIGDTSASMMGDKIWNQLAAEINHCNEFVSPERTRVVWADYHKCSHMQVFEPNDEVKLEPKGGGGTDMRLPLKFMEQYEPCCVLLITDCETPWPDQPTPYPLIVCSTTKTPSPSWAYRLELR